MLNFQLNKCKEILMTRFNDSLIDYILEYTVDLLGVKKKIA